MSCNSAIGKFNQFVNEYRHRKTVPRDEVIKLMIKLVEDSEHNLHHSACYLEGQKPPILRKELKDENKIIGRLNNEIKERVKRMRWALKTFTKYP